MRGQASIEYVVVVALVVAVTAVASTVAAPGIANEIARALRRALCVVGGGDCLATERRPCVTATDARDEEVTVNLAFLRIGTHAGILRQQLSDGSVRVTLIDDLSAGGEAGIGLHGRVQVAGLDLRGGGELQAAALARLGASRTFHLADARAADRLVERLMDRAHGSPLLAGARRAFKRLLGGGEDAPSAASRSFSVGAEGEASASAGGLPAGAEVRAGLKASFGGRIDSSTGRRTLFFDLGGTTAGALTALVAQGRVGGEARAVLAVTYDRKGRPLLLTASVAGEAIRGIGASDALPGVPRPSAGAGRRIEVDARLDLGRPDNAVLARSLLAALDPRHPRPERAAAAAGEIGLRLAREGDLDVRSYDATSSSQGIGAGAALGPKVGADVGVTRSSSRLLAAWNRPSGGVWERRIDCAASA